VAADATLEALALADAHHVDELPGLEHGGRHRLSHLVGLEQLALLQPDLADDPRG
jgi:hypothetical protein